MKNYFSTLCLCLLTIIFIPLYAQGQCSGCTPAVTLDFDGTNDHVRLPNGMASNFSGGKITVSAWSYLDANSTWATIIKNWGGSIVGAYHLGMNANQRRLSIYITQSNGAVRSVVAPSLFPLDQWVHTAFVADGSNLILYQNGVAVGSTTYNGTLKTSLPPTFIGVKPNNSGSAADFANPGYWNGKLDEIRIYNRALCQAEIVAQMNCELTGSEQSLLAYYNFNQGFDDENNSGETILTDLTNNNNNGNLTGFSLSGSSSNWSDGQVFSTTCSPLADTDADGINDDCDVCPNDADNDIDRDGVCGDVDNCPNIYNPNQEDNDNDGMGDICDDDDDNDGCLDVEDANPLVAGIDSDGDGDADECDICPFDADNDIDGDGICGDVDACPNDADNDADGDGVCGDIDNCPATANADQADLDADGIGDICDTELDICSAFNVVASYVASLNLPNNTANFLLDKLTKAQDKYLDGNNNAALGNLGAFINKVNAKTPSQITPAQNAFLISAAQMIMDAINNGTGACNGGTQELVSNNTNSGISAYELHQDRFDVKIFPNPARDVLNVQMQGLEEATTIRIFDAMGRIVFEQNFADGHIVSQIDLSDTRFQNGLYLVRVRSENSKLTKRLVIAK